MSPLRRRLAWAGLEISPGVVILDVLSHAVTQPLLGSIRRRHFDVGGRLAARHQGSDTAPGGSQRLQKRATGGNTVNLAIGFFHAHPLLIVRCDSAVVARPRQQPTVTPASSSSAARAGGIPRRARRD